MRALICYLNFFTFHPSDFRYSPNESFYSYLEHKLEDLRKSIAVSF